MLPFNRVIVLLAFARICIAQSPTVTLPSGIIVGMTTSLPSATASVNQFLGIPFAKSPPERFSPPQEPPSWSTLNTTAFKPACVQQFVGNDAARQFTKEVFNNPGGPTPEESEDCLYLNVFAPSTPAPPGGRTAMFWIYGGGLQFGYAGNQGYDGSKFAAYQDVILVTTAYRTNVFGFSNSPEIPLTSQNAGLLDQRMALEWVQCNIGRFGGDPGKVTIFGESAGASSVDKLITTIPENPPFRGAILESGQASIGQAQANNRSTGLASWNALSAALNCTSLDCVRSQPATLIKSIIEPRSLSFPPVTDNVTQIADPSTARAQGRIAKVPVLTGTNAQEGRVFEVGMNNLTTFLETNFPGMPDLQNQIQAAYTRGSNDTDYDILSRIFTEFRFQCPAALYANNSAVAGIPTWRYYFNASFPNIQAYPNGGVYHSIEIAMVFGTYVPIAVTAQEEALSKYIQGAWADFAKNPTLGPGWNKLGTFNGTDLGDLGPIGTSGVTIIPQSQVDYRCSLFTPLYQATTS